MLTLWVWLSEPNPATQGNKESHSSWTSQDVCKEQWEKYKLANQIFFLKRKQLSLCLKSPFSQGLWYEDIELGREGASTTESKPRSAQQRPFLSGPSLPDSLILYKFFPRRLFSSWSKHSPGRPTLLGRQTYLNISSKHYSWILARTGGVAAYHRSGTFRALFGWYLRINLWRGPATPTGPRIELELWEVKYVAHWLERQLNW